MKKLSLLLLIALSPISTYVEAAGSRSTPWYFGIKGGFMDANGQSDSAINMGADVGYRNNKYLSTEVELTKTVIDGDTPSGNDWEVDTLSVFAAFRSNTEVKLKAKIGLTNIDYGNDDDLELSFGFGAGFWAAGGLMEIEYTEIDDDLEFISLGVTYFF